MTPLDKAERAKHLLEDPVVRAVFADLREQLVARMEALPMNDHEMQHEAVLSLQLLRQVREQLAKYAQEIEVDKHRQRQDSFIERMRQRISSP